jgi:hypothetical protein
VIAPTPITDHRPGEHDTGAGTQGLQQAPGDHGRDAGRGRATGRADDEKDQSDHDRQSAAMAITDRPPQQLSEAETEQIPRDRQLDRSCILLQIGGNGR